MATAHDPEARQPIPLVAPDIEPDEQHKVSRMIESLDGALDAYRRLTAIGGNGASVQVSWCVRGESPVEEHALKLWASAHAADVAIEASEHRYGEGSPNEYRIRSLDLRIVGCPRQSRLAWIQWPSEIVEVKPRTEIDTSQMWSPAHGAAQ